MKKVLLILSVFIVLSCKTDKSPQYKKLKLIAKKEAVVSHYNLITGKQVIETEYYLIFEDGSVIDTSISTYTLAKEGTFFNVPASIIKR